jgi:hypothetical protein
MLVLKIKARMTMVHNFQIRDTYPYALPRNGD